MALENKKATHWLWHGGCKSIGFLFSLVPLKKIFKIRQIMYMQEVLPDDPEYDEAPCGEVIIPGKTAFSLTGGDPVESRIAPFCTTRRFKYGFKDMSLRKSVWLNIIDLLLGQEEWER